ncbi:MAG: 30S ribosomal protein S2 [Parachlamydiales bacterium]|nr:30S ribosomal protein S2 [Parachlamydiales bacterium]
MALTTQKKARSSNISMKDLIEAGAHFGHQTHRWNPKMKRFIYGEKNGIYIIDLAKSMEQIRHAETLLQDMVTQHKSILFVGTKKPAKSIIQECAEQAGEFYVNERWLGGMMTNLSTIRQSIKTLERIEKKVATGGDGLTKKERAYLAKELEKLEKNLSGIRSMRKPPGMLVVVDPGHEHIAVAEAKKLGIPVLALIDTNCDPENVDYIIACNDDSVKSIKIILSTLSEAIASKKKEMNLVQQKEEHKS